MKEDVAVEYKNQKVLVKESPESGDSFSVFVRPGDEVDFLIEGFDPNTLEYQLIGGDIVVVFPNGGMITFASMALMGYSATPPLFHFNGWDQSVSVDSILSQIEEVNELPIESVNASFRIKVSDTQEQTGIMNKSDDAPQIPMIITQDINRYDQNYDQGQAVATPQNFTSHQKDIAPAMTQATPQVQQPLMGLFNTPPNDFNAYEPDEEMIPKPDEEMIPKPDEEMIPKPDEEMIPKPDEEMIPKPDEEMIPENDFISEEEGFGDGWGDSYDSGSGEGAVDEAAKPAFYFKATAHQVRYKESTNADGDLEVLGGGGSVNGYKFDSVTNQYEAETIDMSSRDENMIIRVEDSRYFSNTPASATGIYTLTFKDLTDGQSVTVDGLTLTATGAISAADVAAGFASLASGATAGNGVANGVWSGTSLSGWFSGSADGSTVIFTNTKDNEDIDGLIVTTAPTSRVSATSTDGASAIDEAHTLTFKELDAGQSVTVDGLTLTATGALAAAEVAEAFSDLAAASNGSLKSDGTTANSVTNGSFSGVLSADWSSAQRVDTAVTFTSTSLGADVDDIAVSSAGDENIEAPEDVEISSTQGKEAVSEFHVLTFEDLHQGESVTVAGLTLTATGALTAAEVAEAFSDLAAASDGSLKSDGTTANSVTNGSFSGVLSTDWSSAQRVDTTVTFTSMTPDTDVADIEISSTVVIAPADVEVIAIQGSDTQTEEHALTFQDLADGQSVTVDGLTLTATGGDISATDVAAGFANLDNSAATAGNGVANGAWSGAKSTAWTSGEATGSSVTFTSQTAHAAVADIVVSSAGVSIEGTEQIGVVSNTEVITTYLSRVLRFEPQMPEGFYIENFVLEGLPEGVVLFDKDENEIVGSTITKEQMVFKDALGETIEYGSADFLTNFKSAEFIIKYSETLEEPFNVSITSNYKLDGSYTETTDIEPEQSYTNEYTFVLKDIASADDYIYNKSDFANGLDEGFILAKEPNYNIIKDGGGNSVIYGGIVKDEVYDGLGDDTYYLSAADDTLYGGGGTNFIYGDTYKDGEESVQYEGTDTVSYENVQSFESSEIKLLKDQGFLTAEDGQKLSGSYINPEVDDNGDPLATPLHIEILSAPKGVYVDLDGVAIEELGIDVDGSGEVDQNDKINVLSKFANRVDKFTYDEDGNAVDTTLGKNITFTSTIYNSVVEDIEIVSAGVAEVVAPEAVEVASVQGADDTTETHTLTFKDLIAGQSVSVDGLTLTATGAITAAEVAAAFANLAASAAAGNEVANGEWSGNLSANWSSGDVAEDGTLTFTSTTPTAVVDDISVVSSGVTPIDAPEDVVVSTIQGSNITTEEHNVVFKDLESGQSVSVGGLTLSATASLTATQIAAAFANLDAGATSGNEITGGEWSGSLSSEWRSGAQEQTGLDNLQAVGYDVLEDIENITGSNYNDTLYGNNDKDNVLSGLDGSDIIDGRGGNNTLFGGAGYDTLYSGTGDDSIDGGGDTDKVNYANSAQGVIVRLDKPNEESEDDYAQSYNAAALVHSSLGELTGYTHNELAYTDTLLNIEDVAGSNHDDIIFGNSATNFIEGMGGDDKIIAGGGYDFIDGGAGNDWISYYRPDYISINSIIPEGAVNLEFMEELQGITVTMGTDFVMLKETETGRLIDLIKDVEQVSGTSGNDVLVAKKGVSHTFWGHEGDDRLEGRNGADYLYGGDDDDYIRPYEGLDISYGGAGIDYLELYNDGLAANQILRLNEEGTIQFSANTTNGIDGDWTDGYNGNGGVNLAYEFEGFGASNNAETIYGNSHNNVLNGHNGNDTMHGMGGDDTINGGNNNDTIYGGDGNDILSGGNHDDIMHGDAGDDTFYGSIRYNNNNSDKDQYHGGEGTDILDYARYNHKYVMNVVIDAANEGTITFGGSASNNSMYQDTFTGIERLIASREGDTIDASAATAGMFLAGMNGNDTIKGGSGDDVLYGGVHQDTLYGGSGDDYLNLDQRSDTDTRVHSVNGEYAYGGAGADIIVSQGGRDYLYGDAVDADDAANTTRDIAGDGDDRFIVHNTPYELYGGGGSDTLTLGDNGLDLRSTDVKELEVLELGAAGKVYFNHSQFFEDNSFETITGDENSELWIYGSNGVDDNFDLSGMDLSSFNGKLYANGYNGSDTLTLDGAQVVKMDENYFHTLENFDISGTARLEVYAQNDNADTFHGATKDLSHVLSKIDFIGSDFNDTFELDVDALHDFKISAQGNGGTDRVDFRNFSADRDFSDASYSDALSGVEILDIDQGASHEIVFSAENLAQWIGESNTLTLDIADDAQGANVKIKVHDNQELTTLSIGATYTVNVNETESFELNVV